MLISNYFDEETTNLEQSLESKFDVAAGDHVYQEPVPVNDREPSLMLM